MLIGMILLYGLLYTLGENLEVAPWAETGDAGRLHSHTKNTTRLGGSPEVVRRAVQRAVSLREQPGAEEEPPSPIWREVIQRQIEVNRRPRHLVALAGTGDGAAAWALPGAYWAVYADVPVIFVGRDQAGADALETVRRYQVPVYVLAPEWLVSNAVLQQIEPIAPTHRIAGRDLADHAVAIAEFRDEETGFGWGRTHDERTGYFHYVVAAPSEAPLALAALPLAWSNAATFLFIGDDGGIPAATDRYAWSQRADWFVTPSEGPFRHFWIAGNRLSYAAQGRLDLAPEKGAYLSMGVAALGPMEALFIVFIVLGIAGSIFVWLHGHRLLPEVPLSIRIAWTYTALLVPIVGVILYLAAYRRQRLNSGAEAARWLRPSSVQAAAATAMSFGYGAPLMVAIAYLFVHYGFPLFFGPWA